MITQVFIFGDSVAYGVGAERAGWADLLKQTLHSRMYSNEGVGEKYELYNFGYPASLIEFPLLSFDDLMQYYERSGKVIVIVCVGGNDSKAVDEPDNFLMDTDVYKQRIADLLKKIQDRGVDNLIVVPSVLGVDESKTNPKSNPFTGGKSYFTNERVTLFNRPLMELFSEQGAQFVDIKVDPSEWTQKYLYKDGVHPNQAGHKYMFDKLLPAVEKLLED